MSGNYCILAIEGYLTVYQCNSRGMGEILRTKCNLSPEDARERVIGFVKTSRGNTGNYKTILPNGLGVLFSHIGRGDYTLGVVAR